MGVDVVICDKDEDGSFSWVAWGRGVAKMNHADRLGDLVLVGRSADTGRLRGMLLREDTGIPLAQQQVRVQSLSTEAVSLLTETQRDGSFVLDLPIGSYRLEARFGEGEKKALTAQVRSGREEEISLVVPPPDGSVVKAGKGRTVSTGAGRRGLWRTFDVPDHLSSSIVRAIHQDRRGYLWIWTSGGLSRYDGEEFVSFARESRQPNNDVLCVLEDRAGNLWYGTWGGGVTRYDGESFVTYTTADGLASDKVFAMLEDRAGNLWMGTWGGGVARFDGKEFTTFTTEDGLASNVVSSILEDRKGDLWFGTGVGRRGKRWFSGTAGGVSRDDGEGFVTYTSADGLGSNFINLLFEDRAGLLWFGCGDGGLSRYDGERFVTFSTIDGLRDNTISAIYEGSDGSLWIGRWGEGVSRFEEKEGFVTYTTADGLGDNRVMSLLEDREGSLWVATQGGGVSRYESILNYTHVDGLGDNQVGTLLEDSNGDMWFGTMGGLSRYDGEAFVNYTTEDGLRDNWVYALLADRRGRLWMGIGAWYFSDIGTVDSHRDYGKPTREGLVRYDGAEFTAYTNADGLVNSLVTSLLEDRKGHLWVGTYGGGVTRFDGERFVTYTTAEGLGSNRVLSLLEDRRGNLWVGTLWGGVTRINGTEFVTYAPADGLGGRSVSAMIEDRTDRLWFGIVDGGLSSYDGERFVTYTTAEGLGNDKVFSLLEDRRGDLWIGTRGGISRYDGQVFQSLTRRDGLAHNTVRKMVEDSSGDIWIATDGGVTRYRSRRTPPPIYITDVVADRRYGPVAEISLSSAQDYLAIEFRGISLRTRPGQMVYLYRLRGHDDGWLQTRSGRVEYLDLPRGSYVFETKAVDRDLNYSEAPATVRVTIHAPYSQIGMALGLGAALLVALVSSVKTAQSRRERNLAREELLEGTVEKNQALEEANVRLREADRLKSDFVSNVSHELRTPLAVIKGSVDNMLDGITGAFNEKQEFYLSRLRVHGDRLALLIDDLLDLSRIEAGYLRMNRQKASVAEIAVNVVEYMRALAEEEGIVVDVRKEEEDGAEAWVDPARVYQILLNLVNNAIKFTPSGGRVPWESRETAMRYESGLPTRVRESRWTNWSAFSKNSINSARAPRVIGGRGSACR